MVTAHIAHHRPTGLSYHYEAKRSWGHMAYSFDRETWHPTRLAAFRAAEQTGRLWVVATQPAGDGQQETP